MWVPWGYNFKDLLVEGGIMAQIIGILVWAATAGLHFSVLLLTRSCFQSLTAAAIAPTIYTSRLPSLDSVSDYGQ